MSDKILRWGVAILLSFVVAMVSIRWVGGSTVYSNELQGKRVLAHHAILRNTLPDGVQSWSSIGANGLNARWVTVRIAEGIHVFFGLKLEQAYQIIDLACTFFGILFIFGLLSIWFDFQAAILGVLLLGTIFPMTMFLHTFQPWDKPTFALWVGLVYFAVRDQRLMFLLFIVAATAVKYDSVLAAGLPAFLAFRKVPLRTAISRSLFPAAWAALVLLLLIWSAPGGMEPRPLAGQLLRNIADFRSLTVSYPPFIVHGTLAFLGLLALRRGDSTITRLWTFGLAMLPVHIVFTNVLEVRAQMGIVVCMLPLAVMGVMQLQRNRPGAERAQ
jgi:hypothetical protein